MVSISPRMRDSLDYEEPDTFDPRLNFRSLSLNSTGYEDLENSTHFERPFSSSSNQAAIIDRDRDRKKRRQREHDAQLEDLPDYCFRTVADGDLFRLVVLLPGSAADVVQCRLLWESSRRPERPYRCLSYCWETRERDAEIVVDGARFAVTGNLLMALKSLRRSTKELLIWIDQICINQSDYLERGHQVSIMKRIFSHAKEVVIWLGDEDDRMKKLCEYAKRLRRSDDAPKNSLKKILSPRELQVTMQELLDRPWFGRVWVLPEVALSRHTMVACGRSRIPWDSLVRLIRDSQPPQTSSFVERADLLGNPRQRIAIITQMAASQKKGLAHTDIAQLLILAKASSATDHRDFVYAFYALTHVTTLPDYTKEAAHLFGEVVSMYVNAITWEASYSSWHALNEEQRTFQLLSILYSAGALHQHYGLPSWMPDWTFRWHLAPIWSKTTSNIVTGSGKDAWSSGVRCDYRAGGDRRETFEIVPDVNDMHKLRISVLLFGEVAFISDTAPLPTPSASRSAELLGLKSEAGSSASQYGRMFFKTTYGDVGFATPGIKAGDQLAIVVGGDVPVVLRREGQHKTEKAYKLLCECFIQSSLVMYGDLVRAEWTNAEDIVLV